METLVKKGGNLQKRKDGSGSFGGNGVRAESHTDSSTESRESSGSCRSSTETSSEEVKAKGTSSPTPLGWPIRKAQVSKSSAVSDVVQAEQKQTHLADSKLKKMCSKNSGLLYVWFLRNCKKFSKFQTSDVTYVFIFIF